MPTLTPWNQALSVAVQSANSGNTANAQTGQIFSNATNWPYTAQNAVNNGASISGYTPQATVTPNNPNVWQTSSEIAINNAIQAKNTPVTNALPPAVLPNVANFNKSKWVISTSTPTNQNNNAISPTLTTNQQQLEANKLKRQTQINNWQLPPVGKQSGTQNTGATPNLPTKPTPIAPQVDYYAQANPDQKTKADQLINTMDPAGMMDQNLRNGIRNAYLSGDKATMDAYLAQNGLDTQNITDFISAYRTTRDTALQSDYQANKEQLANDRTTQEFNQSIETQKANVRQQQLANDMLMSTSGRGQSQNLSDTIHQELTNQQNILNNLQQSKSWALWEIADTAKYNNQVLANNYNDQMSQYTYALQDQIKNLSDTGLAGTAQGMAKLQSAIEKTNLQKLALSQTYATQLKFASDALKLKIDAKTPDKDQTNLINDGYLHNKTGEVIMWPSGKPLVYNKTKTIESTVSDGKGGMIAIYSDGTHAPLYEGTPATPAEVDSYAKMVQQYGESALNLLPKNVQTQVMSYMGSKWMWPSKDLDWWIIDYKYDEETGTTKPVMWFIDKSSGTVSNVNNVNPTAIANGGDLRYLSNQYPWQAWAKNNNPAGITWNSNFDKWTGTAKLLTDAGISYSVGTPRPKEEGGNYVTFNTIEDWLKAQQIMMTQTYGNSTVWNMLASWVWTKEWPNYAKQVAGMAGITDLNQKVSALSPDQLSKLQMAKIQKESPWLAKLLASQIPENKWTIEGVTNPMWQFNQFTQPEAGAKNQWVKFSDKQVQQFKEYWAKPPEEYKSLKQKKDYTDSYAQWIQKNPQILSKDEKKDVSGIQNNLAGDQRRKDYLAMASKAKTLEWIQNRLANGTATPQDKQQLINDFAKILDPTSVVREWEYALAGRYSQDKLTAMWQEISNYFATNWPLSNDAAKMLAEWVARRQEAINSANDDAINEALGNVEFNIGRKVPPEALWAKYAPAKSVYTDETGKKYTNDEMIKEINDAISSGKQTPEQIQAFLKAHNITLN